MKTFTDSTGRTWTLRLTLGVALAVRDALGVDLLAPEQQIVGPLARGEGRDNTLMARLGTDELLLGEVLCCMLAGQFETHKVDEADIREAFDGATLLAAQTAFYDELADFFRQRGRADRVAAVTKQKALIGEGASQAAEKIEAIDVAAEVAKVMGRVAPKPPSRKARGGTSGDSPESSASTPAP